MPLAAFGAGRVELGLPALKTPVSTILLPLQPLEVGTACFAWQLVGLMLLDPQECMYLCRRLLLN